MKAILFFLFLFASNFSFAQWNVINLDPSGTEPYIIHKLDFINDSIGFAACEIDAGHPGAIFKTIDWGNTWQKTEVTTALYSLQFISNDTGYAVGIGGAVYRTINQGTSWELLNTLSPWYSLESIYFKNNHESFIGTSDDLCPNCQSLLKSTDGWQTFIPITFPDSAINNPHASVVDILFVSDDTGFAISFTDPWYTVDGGNTWIIDDQLGDQPPSHTRIFENEFNNKLYLTGRANIDLSNQRGSLYISYDIGVNWNEYILPNPSLGMDTLAWLYGGQFVTPNIGYIVGWVKYSGAMPWNNGGIVMTTDGGQTWVDDPVPVNHANYMFTLTCPSGKVCYAGGGNNVILRKMNADLGTSVKDISASHNSQLVLYPNPVTATATIEYQTAIAGKVEITVQNCLGQVVKSLEFKVPGSKVQIDMSGLAAGIYFVKCFDGKEQTVVKMVKN